MQHTSGASDRLDLQRATSNLGRARLSLLVILATLTIGAWVLTLHHALEMGASMDMAVRGGVTAGGMSGMAMAGHSGTGWSLAGASIFVALWTVMMAAMMLPAATPMILVFASVQARRARPVAVPTWIFVSGYLLVWLAIGLLIYVVVHIGSEIAPQLERTAGAPLVLGMALVIAGLFQFTPVKRVCLTHCRSPFAFVALNWRDGWRGALRMGFLHGAYCLGCCWALFAVLVVAGVMSIAWMLLITLLVTAEKVLPYYPSVSRLIGLALLALGLTVGSGFSLPSLLAG